MILLYQKFDKISRRVYLGDCGKNRFTTIEII